MQRGNKTIELVRSCVEKSKLYMADDRLEIRQTPSTPPQIAVHYYLTRFSDYGEGTDAGTFPRDNDCRVLVTGFELLFASRDQIYGCINVHPSHRGEGYGRQLTELMEDIARSLEFRSITLVNQPNEPFFENFGYQFNRMPHKKL